MALSLAGVGCGDDDGPGPDLDGGLPVEDGSTPVDASTDAGPGCEATPNAATYAFESRFEAGASSVSYDGQTFRHLLIEDLKAFVGRLGNLVDADSSGLFDTEEEVVAALDFYFAFDDSSAEESLLFSTEPVSLQSTWGDVSSGKDLVAKLAGNDASTDHLAWEAGDFAGWSTELGGVTVESPETFVRAMFAALAQNAVARANGEQPRGPAGEELPVYVLDSGLDLQQLIQKFLLVAITFSQGTDDYLDDDVDAKGLLSPNTRDGEALYTALEHAWDEGFGYFGAARDFDLYTDDEVAAAGGRADWQIVHDTNGDCRIDLLSEVNFGASTNAAKRDRGATTEIDLGGDAFDAFVAGRRLITETEGELSAEQLTTLRGYRDTIVSAWEKAYAATAVHYINDVLADMDAFGTETYVFADHAKHWAELKGFALAFQFNPRSPLLEMDRGMRGFDRLHGFLGDAPVLAAAGETAVADYRTALEDARALLAEAYAFAAEDVAAW
ncbi:MAG: DUF4856 domain-containing protein [Polyangiales bacterium]